MIQLCVDRSLWDMEVKQNENKGYVICHQYITDAGKIERQMRPLIDWNQCEWYNEACSAPKKKNSKGNAPKNSKGKNSRANSKGKKAKGKN